MQISVLAAEYHRRADKYRHQTHTVLQVKVISISIAIRYRLQEIELASKESQNLNALMISLPQYWACVDQGREGL